MFPVTYNPKLDYCILVPYYDPLIEYYTHGAGTLRAVTPDLAPIGVIFGIVPAL